MYKREIDNQAVVKNSSKYLKLIAIRVLPTQDTFFGLFLVRLYCGSALVVRRNTLTQCNMGLYYLDIRFVDRGKTVLCVRHFKVCQKSE